MFAHGAGRGQSRFAWVSLFDGQRHAVPKERGQDGDYGADLQFSQIICSQQGVLKAFTASLLQMAQRSLKGTSSRGSELAHTDTVSIGDRQQAREDIESPAYLMSSARAGVTVT